MKRYIIFRILAPLCAWFLPMGAISAEEERHQHEHIMPADPFGGYYKSAGADCGSWILCPANSPHGGYHGTLGDWNIMAHGFMNFTYTAQPEPRGQNGFAAPNHFMIMGDREMSGGNLRLSLAVSLDVFTEAERGKPQLLQTGELYHGRENIDVQHRHPLLTNVSGTYIHPIPVFGGNADWFCGAALLGDVSGAPMEFHRASARRFVDVSLFHHGTTDKHIASSVFSCGADYKKIRIAAAAFHGQEPGSNPYSLYLGAPDSFAASFQYVPTRNWAFSLYYANIHNAERHEPGDIKRVTAAAMHTIPLDNGDWWATTLAMTHDKKKSGSANFFVLDSTVKRGKNYFYGRIDAGDKESSLLGTNTFGHHGRTIAEEHVPQDEKSFFVGAGTVGYARTLWQNENTEVGIGTDVTGYVFPKEVKEVYGSFPVSANMYFFVNF